MAAVTTTPQQIREWTLGRIQQTLNGIDGENGYITNEDGQWLIDRLKDTDITGPKPAVIGDGYDLGKRMAARPEEPQEPNGLVARLKMHIARFRALGGIPEMVSLAWELCCENERLKGELAAVRQGDPRPSLPHDRDHGWPADDTPDADLLLWLSSWATSVKVFSGDLTRLHGIPQGDAARGSDPAWLFAVGQRIERVADLLRARRATTGDQP